MRTSAATTNKVNSTVKVVFVAAGITAEATGDTPRGGACDTLGPHCAHDHDASPKGGRAGTGSGVPAAGRVRRRTGSFGDMGAACR